MLIRLENLSPERFAGWVRTKIDRLPQVLQGTVDGTVPYVVADKVGDMYRVDLRVVLAAGEQKTVDLGYGTAGDVALEPMPNLEEWLGGKVMIGDAPMDLISFRRVVRAVEAHWQLRIGSFMHDVWLRFWPGEGWATGEYAVTHSNPRSMELVEVLDSDLLRVGNGVVNIPFRPHGQPPVERDTSFGDGQMRCFPFGVIFPQHLNGQWGSAGAAVSGGIVATGRSGAPLFPAGFNARSWGHQNWLRTAGGLHDWSDPQLGPAANTAQSGSQEDQCFSGRECLLDPVAAAVRYFAALKTAQHPMHHREWDGRVVDGSARPELRMFFSRPHTSGGDHLGKIEQLRPEHASGWNGPDEQHRMTRTLFEAALTFDSPLLQLLLEHHARNYLVGPSSDPTEITSTLWSTRELLWESLIVVHMAKALEDRTLAERVLQHFRDRMERVVINKWGEKPDDIWDVRTDDPRLGTGDWWQLWQQAAGAYGIDLACELIGFPDGRQLALRGAKVVLERGWVQENGRWVEYEHQSTDGARKTRSGFFTVEWMPLAVAVMLKHEPQNEKAQQVWAQILRDANGNGKWLPPELPLS